MSKNTIPVISAYLHTALTAAGFPAERTINTTKFKGATLEWSNHPLIGPGLIVKMKNSVAHIPASGVATVTFDVGESLDDLPKVEAKEKKK